MGSHHSSPAAWGLRGRGGHQGQGQGQGQVHLKVAGKTDGRLVTQLKIRTKSGAILGPVGGGAGQVGIICNLIGSLFFILIRAGGNINQSDQITFLY